MGERSAARGLAGGYWAALGILTAGTLAACGRVGGGGGETMGEDAERAVASGIDSWQVLFDGSSLDRWNSVGDANWRIEGNTVRADAGTGNGFLVSDVDYADFELTLEFWVDVPANSGVFIRCTEHEVIGADNCYEINIYDTRPDPTYRTGAIVNFAPPAEMVNTGGRWNRYEISAQGNRLRATLNDIEMFDIEDGTYASGPIALQYGSGTVIFRDVRVRAP
jgi:hypothetical protein